MTTTIATNADQPQQLHLRIVEILKRSPEGISECDIRHALLRQGVPECALADLHRRLQELDRWFIIDKLVAAENDPPEKPLAPRESIDPLLRAMILYRARGRCARCRRSIQKDGVTLTVQRKQFLRQGQSDDPRHFWAICEGCSSSLYQSRTGTGYGARPKHCRDKSLAR